MDWKNFLKPTIGKAAIFIVLALAVYFFAVTPGGDWAGFGFPLFYFERGASQLPGSGWSQTHYINAIVDVLVWYLVSCVIMALYCEIRKK